MEHRPFLESALDAEIVHQVREATNFTPRHVVLSRVVETVCHHLNLPLAALPDYKNTIRLDTETKKSIEAYWHASNSNNNNDDTELEKILAKDYHKPGDIVRFVGILSKRASKQTDTMPKLYEILAMDGYLGTQDPKRYVEYLKLDSNETKRIHVRAVRLLYRDGMVCTPSETYDLLRSTFDASRVCDLPKCEEAKTLYSTCVGNAFDSIREWKLQQEKDESKRQKEMAAKRKTDPQQQPESKSEPVKKRAKKNAIKTPPTPPVEGDESVSSESDESNI